MQLRANNIHTPKIRLSKQNKINKHLFQIQQIKIAKTSATFVEGSGTSSSNIQIYDTITLENEPSPAESRETKLKTCYRE